MSYLYSFLAVFVTSLLLTPLVRATVRRLGILDHPREDRWHCRPVALMGGIAIFFSFGVGLIWIDGLRDLAVLLLGGVGIFLIGLLDDATHASPFFKLSGQLAVGIVVPVLGIRPDLFPSSAANIALGAFWIVGITNATNLIDGLDGLAAGVSLIISAALGVLSWQVGNMQTLVLCAAIAGACLGFLRYNFRATIFMGDCGALFLGYMLSVLAILVTTSDNGPALSRALPVLMALSVPIFDTTFVTATRLFSRRPPWEGGRDHTFYRLAFYWKNDATRAVLAFYGLTLVSAVLTIGVSRMGLWAALATILVWGFFLTGLGIWLGRVPVMNGANPNDTGES